MRERRKYPRIDNCLPLKLSYTDFDIVTETKNLSASGVYCAVNKPLEPMTKLNIVLLVPDKAKGHKNIHKINCQGVVVRKEESPNIKNNGKHPYCIGIFFNDIKKSDRQILIGYINSHIDSQQPIPKKA